MRREYYEQNKQALSDQRLKARYGLTRAQLESMQAKGCGICGSHRNLRIDHDHGCCAASQGRKTCGNCVRGVLCHRCNVGLAFVESHLTEALEYLASNSSTTDDQQKVGCNPWQT